MKKIEIIVCGVVVGCLSISTIVLGVLNCTQNKTVVEEVKNTIDLNQAEESVLQFMTINENKGSTGTVFKFSKEGYFFTNYHVITIDDIVYKESLYIVDKNNDRIKADLIYSDYTTDIAILKCEYFKDLPSIKLCDNPYNIGDKCYSFGNGDGLRIKCFEGIISDNNAKEFIHYKFQIYIKAEVEIYPGCSGGCLLNTTGACIGMTTFNKKDSSGKSINDFSYSIPVERLKIAALSKDIEF